MGTIKQATYGDEKSSTDITDTIVQMFKKGNGFVEVDVGPKLLSTKEVGGKVELNDTETAEVKRQAEESCGNALDAECIRTTSESLRASKLAKKAREEASKVIGGERLTVTVIGLDGKERTIVAPRDNVFRFGKQKPSERQQYEMGKAGDALMAMFTPERAGVLVGTVVSSFIWAFGTAFAWLMLSQSYTLPDGQTINPGNYWWLKWLGAAIALFTAGYGGFIAVLIAFFVLGLQYYVGKRSLLASTQ